MKVNESKAKITKIKNTGQLVADWVVEIKISQNFAQFVEKCQLNN